MALDLVRVWGVSSHIPRNLDFVGDRRIAYICGELLITERLDNGEQFQYSLGGNGSLIGATGVEKGVWLLRNEGDKVLIEFLDVSTPNLRRRTVERIDYIPVTGHRFLTVPAQPQTSKRSAALIPDVALWNSTTVWLGEAKPFKVRDIAAILPPGMTSLAHGDSAKLRLFLISPQSIKIAGPALKVMHTVTPKALALQWLVWPQQSPEQHLQQSLFILTRNSVLRLSSTSNQLQPVLVTSRSMENMWHSPFGELLIYLEDGTFVVWNPLEAGEELHQSLPEPQQSLLPSQSQAGFTIDRVFSTDLIDLQEESFHLDNLHFNSERVIDVESSKYYAIFRTESKSFVFKLLPPNSLAFHSYTFHFPSEITALARPLWKRVLFAGSPQRSLLFDPLRNEIIMEPSLREYGPPVAASFHPTGHYIVVAFPKEVMLFTVLNRRLTQLMVFPFPNSSVVSFHPGGHLFAAQNGNSVLVISFPTGDVVNVLRGHSGIVHSLGWAKDMLWVAYPGRLIFWNPYVAERIRDVPFEDDIIGASSPKYPEVERTVCHNAVVLWSHSRLFYVRDYSKYVLDWPAGNITTAALIHTHIYIGTDSGHLVTFAIPDEHGNFEQTSSVRLFKSGVKSLDPDSESLFVTSRTGELLFFRLEEPETPFPDSGEDIRAIVESEVLMDRNGVLELTDNAVSLQKLLKQEEVFFEEQRAQLQDHFRDLKAATQLSLEQRIIEAQTAHEAALSDLAEVESSNQEAEKKLKLKYEGILHEIKEGFEIKKAKDKDEVERLQEEKQRMEAKFKAQREELSQRHRKFLSQLTEDYEILIKQEKRNLDALKQQKLQKKSENEEKIKQLEDELGERILALKMRFKSRLRDLNLEIAALEEANVKTLAALEISTAEIQRNMKTIQTLYEKDEQQRALIVSEKKDKKTNEREIGERKQTLLEKNGRIKALKAKIKELEKFKFVLSYKILELKNLISPKFNLLFRLKESLQRREKELAELEQKGSELSFQLERTRMRFRSVKKEQQNITLIAEPLEMKKLSEVFERELKNCLKLKAKMEEKFLHKKKKLFVENAALVSEINSLRKAIKQQQQRNVEVSKADQLKVLKAKVQRLEERLSAARARTAARPSSQL